MQSKSNSGPNNKSTRPHSDATAMTTKTIPEYLEDERREDTAGDPPSQFEIETRPGV
jgi:hypothetical protein